MGFCSSRRALLLSAGLNACFLALFTSVCIYKRNSIAARLDGMFRRHRPSEAVLSTFNTDPYQFVNGREEFSPDAPTVGVLFLGNSLTYHAAPAEEPDKTPRGLTSTAPERDYVHLLVQRLSQERQVNVAYSLTNIADFERHFADAPFDVGRLSGADVREPDYVIFQIGENVGGEDIGEHGGLFAERYTELVRHFDGAVKIVCLPWWPDARKNAAITRVAISTGAYLVDISHLGSGIDRLNYAGSYRKYRQPGVDTHPGDYGMRNIADCLWTVFNAE